LLTELLVLHRDRLMQVLPAPGRQRLKRSLESALRRLALDHPCALSRPSPIMGEAQEVECCRRGWSLFLRCGVSSVWRAEPYQPSLLRVDRQAELAHPFGQYVHDPSCVVLSGYPDEEVISITYQERLALEAGANFVFEPHVEHIVQEDVGQKRARYS